MFLIRGEGLFFPFVPFGRAERENREKGEQKEGGSFFSFFTPCKKHNQLVAVLTFSFPFQKMRRSLPSFLQVGEGEEIRGEERSSEGSAPGGERRRLPLVGVVFCLIFFFQNSALPLTASISSSEPNPTIAARPFAVSAFEVNTLRTNPAGATTSTLEMRGAKVAAAKISAVATTSVGSCENCSGTDLPVASSAATPARRPSMQRRPLRASGAGPEKAMISGREGARGTEKGRRER